MEQGDFARLVGVDSRTVARWEEGKVQPTGAAVEVMNGLREKLEKDPNSAEEIIKFVVGAAAIGGLAYLLIKALDAITEKGIKSGK